MKKAIGANDAIDNDSVGAAVVENFALRVFSAADNEDRSGRATRYVSLILPLELETDCTLGSRPRNSWLLQTSSKSSKHSTMPTSQKPYVKLYLSLSNKLTAS